jgi:hypothetical protein
MSISLHNNSRVVKHGGRFIARMSNEEFMEKIQKFVGEPNEFEDEEDAIDRLFDYLFSEGGITNKLYDDFKGFLFTGSYTETDYRGNLVSKNVKNELHFDLENVYASISDVDDCPYILVSKCGGDWQWPFCFMIYHDGKTFRAFVPTYGNAWIPFIKGGEKCKGLVGEFSASDGYEYGGEIDWKPILKAMGKRYDGTIINEAFKKATSEYSDVYNPEYFIRDYGFDPTEIDDNFENFRSYCKEKIPELLKMLKDKGTVTGVSKYDEYIARQIMEVIFENLNEDLEETDEDNCIYEFEERVEPYDM